MMFELSSHRNLIEWYSSIRDNAVGSAPPAVTSPDEVETPVEAVGIHHTQTCKCLQGEQACVAVHTTQLHYSCFISPDDSMMKMEEAPSIPLRASHRP